MPHPEACLRAALLFPEGPLCIGVPCPDSSANAFCHSCHGAGHPVPGLGLAALDRGSHKVLGNRGPARRRLRPSVAMGGPSCDPELAVVSFTLVNMEQKNVTTLAVLLLTTSPDLSMLRAIGFSKRPRGVRELADMCGLSPRGSLLVLERLQRAGLVLRERQGYRSSIGPEDQRLLRQCIASAQRSKIRASARRISRDRSRVVVRWLRDGYAQWRRIKSRNENTSRPAA